MRKNLLSRLEKTLCQVEECRCCYKSSCRHPEFISGSQESKEMLKQVQHDGYSIGQASNPPQYDGWYRTSLTFGRSMIEMLGVLAIIGVLSIGGLYAYRQAMNSYLTGRISHFMNQAYFAVNEACFLADKCQFPIHVPNIYDDVSINQRILCSSVGDDFCLNMSTENEYIPLPFLKSIRWTLLRPSDDQVNFYLIGFTKEFCMDIFSKPLPPLYLVGVGAAEKNGYIYAEADGSFSPDNLNKIKAQCMDDPYMTPVTTRIIFGWKKK